MSNLRATTCFSSRRKAPRPARQPQHDSAEIVRTRHLLDKDFSLERAWSEINDAPARAAASTIEELMFSLRAGGVRQLRDSTDRVQSREAGAAMTQLPHWTNRLLQELSAAQDQAEFERVLAAYRDLFESLSPQEHELLLEAVVDLRFEQAT